MLRKSLLLCLFYGTTVPALGLTPVRTPSPKAEETLRRQIEHSLEFLRPVPSRWERLNEWVDAHRKEIMSVALGALLTWIVMRHQARAKSRKHAAELMRIEDRLRGAETAHITALGAFKEKKNGLKGANKILNDELSSTKEKLAAEQQRTTAMDIRLQGLIQQLKAIQAAQAAQLQASINTFGATFLSPTMLDRTSGLAATPGSGPSVSVAARSRGSSDDSSSGNDGDKLLSNSLLVSPASARKDAEQSGVVAVSPLTATEQIVV